MKRFIFISPLLLLFIVLLASCQTVHQMSNSNHEHATNHLQRDSIYLHDSTATEYRWGERLDNTMPNERPQADLPCRVDTVLVHQWHTRWREKETIRTDTIVTYETKTETVQVRYVPPFYKYCTIFALLVVAWGIWRRVR